MSFASKSFFIFLPLVLLGYHLLRGRERKYRALLAASWLFYMSWNPWFLWVILFTTVVDYFAGRLIETATSPGRRRLWLTASIVSNLGFLAAFKYTGFVLGNGTALLRALGWPAPDLTFSVVLPLGISFHTFQGISYTLDVYRGRIRAVRGFADFALFVAFFPQLVAGPIVRAVEFLPQMVTPPRVTPGQVADGLHWFLVGMVKKVFLADRLAQFVDPVFADPHGYDVFTHRWAVFAYAVQIYCDFSGYSDIAIGCAKWFGFELPLNFDFPYVAGSIADFWRRWHISLSAWLRDYLYIPLGGSRRGIVRTYVNLLLTMTLCGLWHGASWTFIFWGFYNGVLLALHRVWDRGLTGRPWADALRGHPAYRLLSVAGTFLLAAAGFAMIRSQSWETLRVMELSLVGWGTAAGVEHWVPAWVPLLLCMVLLGHLLGGVRGRRCGLLDLPPLLRAATYVAAVLLLLAFGPGATKAFIYFAF